MARVSRAGGVRGAGVLLSSTGITARATALACKCLAEEWTVTVDRRYWIGVVSREHVMLGVKGGFIQLNHGKRAPLPCRTYRREHKRRPPAGRDRCAAPRSRDVGHRASFSRHPLSITRYITGIR